MRRLSWQMTFSSFHSPIGFSNSPAKSGRAEGPLLLGGRLDIAKVDGAGVVEEPDLDGFWAAERAFFVGGVDEEGAGAPVASLLPAPPLPGMPLPRGCIDRQSSVST